MGLGGALVGGMVVFYWATVPSVAKIDLLWPGPEVARIIATAQLCEKPYLVSAGYGEASLVFNTRTDIELTDGASAATVLAENDCAIALVEQRQFAAFRDHASELALDLRELGQVSGFNIGGGRPLDLRMYAAE